MRVAVVVLLLLSACTAHDREREDRIASLTTQEKISLAASILVELHPSGYCVSTPRLEDVVAGLNSRVTISIDEPELGYPENTQGTVVGFHYICGDREGLERVSEHLVNLRTREVSVHQVSRVGEPAGQLRFADPPRR